MAADALAGTPEAVDARLLRRLKRALQHGQTQGGDPSAADDNLKAFITNLGNTEVLQRDSEAALGNMVRKGAVAEQGKAALGERLGRQATLAEAAAEQGLLSAAHLQLLLANAVAARALLVQHNLRLVISIAKRYTNRGVDVADLVQEGLVGLSKSIDKFCVAKGYKFSTYASWWIRQTITRCISERSRVVRLPVHIYEAFARINRVRDELRARNGSPPSDEEVGALLGLPPARVAAYRRHVIPARSLEQPVQPGVERRDPLLWADKLVADDVDESSALAGGGMREDINAALSTLPPRERNVVRMRYGLHRTDGQSMNLHEVSAAYGLSKERIRQIEETAMSKLRLPWRRTLLSAPSAYSGEQDVAGELDPLAV
ncbi:hypothetical protein WJX81_003904 [Elliptochloris bilobata]|uniref:RNA polymerase sigma-70 domain-containing protein n=1 Tax=Elliptochloris bilobata TaxID=381761 RepID=A0AAW1S4C0_9CHLO